MKTIIISLAVTIATIFVTNATAQTYPIVVSTPSGGQAVCVISGRYVNCY